MVEFSKDFVANLKSLTYGSISTISPAISMSDTKNNDQWMLNIIKVNGRETNKIRMNRYCIQGMWGKVMGRNKGQGRPF